MAHHDRNHMKSWCIARQLHEKLRNKSLFKPVPLKKAFENRPDETNSFDYPAVSLVLGAGGG